MENEYNGSISENAEQNGSLTSAPPEVTPDDFRETDRYRQMESPGSGSQEEEVYRQPEPAPEQEEPSTPVMDALRSKGYDISGFDSDEDFIRETEARYASASQAEEDIASQQMYAQQQAEYLQNQQQVPQQAPQQAPQQVPQQEQQGSPSFDPGWADLVEDDGAGRYVIRPEYVGSVDPQIADRVNEYVSFRQKRSNALIDDPVQTMMQAGLEQQIQSRVDNAVNQALSSNKLQGDASQFIEQNADILYLKDPKTNSVRTDKKGSPILSPVGKALNDAHVLLRQQGMYEPVARHRVATQMVQNYFTQQQLSQVQGQVAQPTEEQYKQEYTSQPFAQPTNPLPPGYMPNTPVQPNANALGGGGLPEHNSLGSLATALAVHKGFLQPK